MMEFSSEFAVIQSSIQFAMAKYPGNRGASGVQDVCEFCSLLCPSIQEVSNGLERDLTNEEQDVLKFKILAFFISHIVNTGFHAATGRKTSEYEEVTLVSNPSASAITTHRTASDQEEVTLIFSPPPSEEVTLVCKQPTSKSITMFQHIPCLSLPIVVELVKRLQWHSHFLKCLQAMAETVSVSMVLSTVTIVTGITVISGSLKMVVTCLKYLTWLVMKSTNQSSEVFTKVVLAINTIAKWLGNQVKETNLKQCSENSTDENIELLHLATFIGLVTMETTSIRNVHVMFDDLEITKHEDVLEKDISKVLKVLKQNCVLPSGGQEVFCIWNHVNQNCESTAWLELAMFFSRRHENSESLDHPFLFSIAKVMTLDLGDTFVDMEKIFRYVLDLFSELKTQDTEWTEKLSSLNTFLIAVEQEFKHCHQVELDAEKLRQEQITLKQHLCQRLPGFEEKLSKMVACADFDFWESEGYVGLLTENNDLLFRETDICVLHQTLNALVMKRKDPNLDQTLCDIFQVFCRAFSRLPVTTQEKIIMDDLVAEVTGGTDVTSCPADVTSCLATMVNFEQDLTLVFNQITSEPTQEQLLAVLRLFVVDATSVMQYAVSVAVKSPGQIAVVSKIFRSLPELCRLHTGGSHPRQSILCRVICEHTRKHPLGQRDEKNLVKFVALLVQDFKRTVCGHSFIESAVLSPGEFASNVVLPFIGSLESHKRPISTEFALKLFSCLLEQAPGSDWLSQLQTPALLLCLCQVLHECVELWDSSHVTNKLALKQLCMNIMQEMHCRHYEVFSTFSERDLDWLEFQTKKLDWIVILHLQRTLAQGAKCRQYDFETMVDCVAGQVLNCVADNSMPLLRFVSMSDENLAAADRHVEEWDRVFSLDHLTTALAQVLPNLVMSEWKRVAAFLVHLARRGHIAQPYRLLFSETIVFPCIDKVKDRLAVVQLLTNVVVATANRAHPHTPSTRHVITGYVTVLQDLLRNMGEIQDENAHSLALSQMFSHGVVAMTTMEFDQSEQLFVLLLDLVTKYRDLQGKRGVKTQVRKSHCVSAVEDVFIRAVRLVTENEWQDMLRKKLDECSEI